MLTVLTANVWSCDDELHGPPPAKLQAPVQGPGLLSRILKYFLLSESHTNFLLSGSQKYFLLNESQLQRVWLCYL